MDQSGIMDAQKDIYFKRNAFGVASVEFFWGLGFPVILESTFLQIFLMNMGASNFLIGMVPSILILGSSAFPLLASYLTQNSQNKKMIVVYLHVVSSLSTLLFGIFLFFVTDPSLILPVFFLSYLIFSICIGMTVPVWLNFLVKIFSQKKSVQGFSIMMISQNFAKLVSSIFIMKIVEACSMSLRSSAWIFLMAGLLFLVGSFCFMLTTELPGRQVKLIEKESFAGHIKRTVIEMIQNKNLMKYLAGDLDYYVILTIISFYANYAVQFFNISPGTAAGLFVALVYTGSILANFVIGTLDFLTLKQKFISTKIMCFVMLGILIFMPTLTGFLSASFLMGFCRGVRSIIYSPAIRKFADKEEITSYFAAAPLLTIVFGSGFPAVFGKILDTFAHLGSQAYVLVFSISMGLVVLIFAIALATDFENVKKC